MTRHYSLESLLTRLVSINSVFPAEAELVNFCEGFLQSCGFTVSRVPAAPDRDALIATLGESQSYLCLYGHLDTVPPDPLWQQDPFTVTQSGDILRGLGVADMKGGIAIILQTAAFAQEHNLPLKIALGVDEENISLGSFALIQTSFFDNVGLLISAESGQVVSEAQDFAVNYGRKGRVALTMQVEGKTAHAAQSNLAVNAISEVSRFVNQLHSLEFPAHEVLGTTEVIPFFAHSSTDSFSIPELAELRLNVLTVPGVSHSTVIEKLQDLVLRLEVTATFQLIERATPYMEAYAVDRESHHIQNLERQIFSRYTVTPGYAQSVADENRFAQALSVPVISIGPIGGGDHTAGEWVSLSSLHASFTVYTEIVRLFNHN
jgi:acetylornithine deacetylase